MLEVLCFDPLEDSARTELLARQNRKKNALKIFALRIDIHSVESNYIGQCDPGLKRKPMMNCSSMLLRISIRTLTCYNLLPMMPIDSLKNISNEDRFRGAVWGQFVGDAAALGTHWIYDLAELQQLYPGSVHGFNRGVKALKLLKKALSFRKSPGPDPLRRWCAGPARIARQGGQVRRKSVWAQVCGDFSTWRLLRLHRQGHPRDG